MGLAHSGLQILGLAQPRVRPLIKTGAAQGGASTYEILNSAVIMNTLVCTFAVDSDQGLK